MRSLGVCCCPELFEWLDTLPANAGRADNGNGGTFGMGMDTLEAPVADDLTGDEIVCVLCGEETVIVLGLSFPPL